MQQLSLSDLSKKLRESITLNNQQDIAANLINCISYYISLEDFNACDSLLNIIKVDHSAITASRSSKLLYYKSLVLAYKQEYSEALEYCKYAINSLPPLSEQLGNVRYFTILLFNLKALLTLADKLTVVPIDEIYTDPYIELLAAVNFSNDKKLQDVMSKYDQRFKEDNLAFLTQRMPTFLQNLKDIRIHSTNQSNCIPYHSDAVSQEIAEKTKVIAQLYNEIEISFRAKKFDPVATESVAVGSEELEESFDEE